MPSTTAAASLASFRTVLDDYRSRFDQRADAWLRQRQETSAGWSPETVELIAELSRLVKAGGKRLRPILVETTYRAFGGKKSDSAARLGLASELLHTYLLVHDDIMDRAETRRGLPTTHVVYRERHRANGWHGDAADFGRSMAILVGDLAHTYAVELVATLPESSAHDEMPTEGDLSAVRLCFSRMCEEVIGGQYLEMLVPYRRDPSAEDLERVLRLKSGRYSVERPMELGARLAGAGDDVLAALARFGHGVGEAFQLRDDLLGVFGDSAAIGKSVGGDLAEGKHTFLIHHTLKAASDTEASWLRGVLGDTDMDSAVVDEARDLIRRTGALDRVQEMIEQRLDEAHEGLTAIEELSSVSPGPWSDQRPVFDGLIEYLRERDR